MAFWLVTVDFLSQRLNLFSWVRALYTRAGAFEVFLCTRARAGSKEKK